MVLHCQSYAFYTVKRLFSTQKQCFLHQNPSFSEQERAKNAAFLIYFSYFICKDLRLHTILSGPHFCNHLSATPQQNNSDILLSV